MRSYIQLGLPNNGEDVVISSSSTEIVFSSSSSADNFTTLTCNDLLTCSDCVDRLGCAWCSYSKSCEDVKVLRFYDNCKDWMWGQCSRMYSNHNALRSHHFV